MIERTPTPTDEQIDELWDEIGGYYNLYPEVRNTIREALNRWGTPEPKEKEIRLVQAGLGFRIGYHKQIVNQYKQILKKLK